MRGADSFDVLGFINMIIKTRRIVLLTVPVATERIKRFPVVANLLYSSLKNRAFCIKIVGRMSFTRCAILLSRQWVSPNTVCKLSLILFKSKPIYYITMLLL